MFVSSWTALVTAQTIQKLAITSGDWSVCGSGLWVDEVRRLIYFIGLKDTPLEQHLYVTSLAQPGVIQRLTQPGYFHQVALNDVSLNLFFCYKFYLNHFKLKHLKYKV